MSHSIFAFLEKKHCKKEEKVRKLKCDKHIYTTHIYTICRI